MMVRQRTLEIFSIVLLVASLCLCEGECPIECYCDETTICSGDKLLDRLPTFQQIHRNSNTNNYGFHGGNPSFDGVAMTRLELHDFLVDHVDRVTMLNLIGNLTEFRLTSNVRLNTLDNDTFVRRSKSNVSVSASAKDEEGENLHLRTLDLSGNSLVYFVAGGRLAGLRVLDLSSNRLQQVYDLQSLLNLESVNLRDNQIQTLEASLFKSLRNLQYINLDSNQITRLEPTTFSNLPSLAHLILSSNPIRNLLPGFVWNSRVQFVDVSRVGLDRIPTSLTTSVRDFRCANNNLTTIRQSDFESFPNVGLLVLDENEIETIEDDAFGRLEFLARLWINGNRLSRVPQNLPPSLRSLQLEDNLITSVSSSDFHNLVNLEELNLHGNRVAALPAFTFAHLSSLRNLDLRSNNIDTIQRDSLGNLTKLETLDMSQNPIRVIVNGVFGDLAKLSLLHLSRLREKNLELNPSSFHSLVNLEILELDDSPLVTQAILRESALGYFMNLIELNLQRCDLTDLHLVAQSLLDSPIFDSLRVVKLSGNPWNCHPSVSSGSGSTNSESVSTEDFPQSELESEPDLDSDSDSDFDSQSGSNSFVDEFKAFLQLYRKKVIVDVDQMICEDPKGIKVMNVALNSILNDTANIFNHHKNKTSANNNNNRNHNNKSRNKNKDKDSVQQGTATNSSSVSYNKTNFVENHSKTSSINSTSSSSSVVPISSVNSSTTRLIDRETFSAEKPSTLSSSTSRTATVEESTSTRSYFEEDDQTQTDRPFLPSLAQPHPVPHPDDMSEPPIPITTTRRAILSISDGHGHAPDHDGRETKSGSKSERKSGLSSLVPPNGISGGARNEDKDEDGQNGRKQTAATKKTNDDDNAIIDEERNPTRSKSTHTHTQGQIHTRARQGEKAEEGASRQAEEKGKHPQQLEHQHQPGFAETVGGSIDGFPASHDNDNHKVDGIDDGMRSRSVAKDSDASSSASSHSSIKNLKSRNPKPPSYLKSESSAVTSSGQLSSEGQGHDHTSWWTSSNGAVILKTLLISAAACLLTILFLLLLSLAVFRFPSWKSKIRPVIPFPVAVGSARRKIWWEGRGELEEENRSISSALDENLSDPASASASASAASSSTPSSSYRQQHHHHHNSNNNQRSNLHPSLHHFPHPHRGPTGMSYTRLHGDQDTVELSGITNRLYFENEDIYHIT